MAQQPYRPAAEGFYSHPWAQRLRDRDLNSKQRIELIKLIMLELVYHRKSGLEDHFEQEFPPDAF